MNADQVDADMRTAVDRRLAERLDNARRRRAARERARAEKQARRDAGLRKRHATKLARALDAGALDTRARGMSTAPTDPPTPEARSTTTDDT